MATLLLSKGGTINMSTENNSYSRLKMIEVINFMGYENSKVVFDEQGSVNIKGYNNSGKSAFLTSIAVALLNKFPQKQVGYIRHGCDYFRIIVSFDDGVVIVRDKYKSGQSLYELYKGEQKVFTTKIGNKLGRVDAVPEVIQNYLGLIVTEFGCLNYQVRRDPLWLIDTAGSENYYSLNEVLKSVEIAQANAMINSDKNVLGTEIAGVESQLRAYEAQLDKVGTISEDLLGLLYERKEYASNISAKYNKLVDIFNLCSEISEIRVSPSVEPVKGDRILALDKVSGIVSAITENSYFSENIPTVSIGRFNSISKVLSIVSELSSIKYFGANISGVNIERSKGILKIISLVNEIKSTDCFDAEIPAISTEKAAFLVKLSELFREYVTLEKSLAGLGIEFGKLSSRRDDIIKQAESEGKRFIVCDNCGTMLEV